MLRAALLLALLSATALAAAPRPKSQWRMGTEEWEKVEKKLEEGDEPELLVSEDKIAMDEYDRRRGEGLQPPEEDVALKCVCRCWLPAPARARTRARAGPGGGRPAPPAPPHTHPPSPTARAHPLPFPTFARRGREGNEWLRHTQAMTGPAMMFVSLNPTDPKGEPWTKKSLERLSSEWASLCKTAGLDAKVYDISEGAQDAPVRTRKPSGSVTPTPTKSLPPARMLVSMNTGWRGYELRDFMLRRPELESMEWDQVKYTPADLDEDGNFKGGVLGKNAAPLPAGLADMGPRKPAKAAKPKKPAFKPAGPPTPRPTPAAAAEEKDEF